MESERVLELLRKIPKGRVTTYKILAQACGSKGYRAVGQILKNNPRPDMYPCYRVVRSDGSLGGYSGSLKANISKKKRMLAEDGITFNKGRIDLEKHLCRV